MTILCMIRHGETDWNAERRLQGQTDIPLNEKGRRQARITAAHLKKDQWDVILSSPLSRARETADLIAQEVQLPVIEIEEFIERTFGDAEGMTQDERANTFPERKYPNEETVEVFHDRLKKGLKHITEHYPDKRVILVAHGAVINAILSILSEGEIGSGKTRLENAGISHFHFKDQKWAIGDYNLIDHLTTVTDRETLK
ncbi:histidine phosphatase family protein [Jeotgalibacillus sp. R-1-5s-1]|uniref:histidine phosphatase family protein n=1 Tax=Jeotgalibacillus sp. R-1-5s-1 TaxID=2555897 RepID=UPI00106BF9CC|nr:histidine phosphatase family protein [Jeotgalibacillus sp. R-1-5s-1]TFE00803.1 histidine phosphatase family protein [Jeotgalibacillus sp. R-1-5s-1]